MSIASQLFPANLTEEQSEKKCFWIAVIATMIVGLAAHAFCWTNSLYSHDSLMIIQDDWNEIINADRFLQIPYILIRGRVVAPWLVGFLGLCFLSFANANVMVMLRIRHFPIIIGLSGLLATYTTLTLINASYIKDFDIDMLALLFAVLAARAAVSNKKHSFVLSGVLLACSLGLYAAYISITITLFILCLIEQLLEGHGINKTILKMFLTLVIGLAAFLCISFVAHWLNRTAGGGYNSVVSNYNELPNVIYLIGKTYSSFFQVLLVPETLHSRVVGFINVIAAAWFIFIAGYLAYKKSIKCLLLVSILVLILPLAMDAICIFSLGKVMHGVMIYSFSYLYVAAALMTSLTLKPTGSRFKDSHASKARKAASVGFACLSVIVIVSNISYSNSVYLRKNLEWQATLPAMNQLTERILSQEDFSDSETPVCFIGSFNQNNVFSQNRDNMPPYRGFKSHSNDGSFTLYATGVDYGFPITYPRCAEWYFRYVMGKPFSVVSKDSLSEGTVEKAAAMQVYPADGSIAIIDGVLLIKLS